MLVKVIKFITFHKTDSPWFFIFSTFQDNQFKNIVSVSGMRILSTHTTGEKKKETYPATR